MAAGYFSGVFRWLMGRLGSPPMQTGGGVCATVSLAPRVAATASLSPNVSAAVTLEVC